MEKALIQKINGTFENNNLPKLGSLYLECYEGGMTNCMFVLKDTAVVNRLSGAAVNVTENWRSAGYKAITVESSGPTSIEITDFYGMRYIDLVPYATKFRINNISQMNIFRAFQSRTDGKINLARCEISGDVAALAGLTTIPSFYIQSEEMAGDIASLGNNTGATLMNFYGSNIYGDEDALFDALASNGKTTNLSFDFRNTRVLSSSGKPLNGVVVFSGSSWSIQ